MKNGLPSKYINSLLFLSFVSIIHTQAALAEKLLNQTELKIQATELYKKSEHGKVTSLIWKNVEIADRELLLLLAQSHENRKEPLEELKALNLALSKNSKDFEVLTLIAHTYLSLKKEKEALENYKSALEINQKHEPAYMGLVHLYEKRNPPNLYELRILFQDMIQHIGSKFQYELKLCEINFKDNAFDLAIQNCKSAIKKDHKSADPYVLLGKIFLTTGETERGNQYLKKAAENFPKSENAQYSYGKYLEEDKKYIDALKYYKAGVEIAPESERCWIGLANINFELKKYEDALTAFRNACRYDKKNATAFRKATSILKNNRISVWGDKFDSYSENCDR